MHGRIYLAKNNRISSELSNFHDFNEFQLTNYKMVNKNQEQNIVCEHDTKYLRSITYTVIELMMIFLILREEYK